MEEIHDSRFSGPITVDDVDAAKEAIIRSNPVYLDYLKTILSSDDIFPSFKSLLNGSGLEEQGSKEVKLILGLGVLKQDGDELFRFANSIYAEAFAEVCPQTPNFQQCPQISVNI